MTKVNRRNFLYGMTATALGCAAPFPRAFAKPRRVIHTAGGPIEPGDLGLTLMHEHVMVDFAGADKVSPTRYNPDEVAVAASLRLRQIRVLGCRTLVECTPAYLGRDARLLRRLAQETGLRIVTNTGYYGAAGGKYLPAHAHTETAQQLAARWIAEWQQGIDGTGIRPGILKTSVNAAPLSEVDQKLVRAAALTQRATGLAIASHTGSGAAALAQLDILKAEGVPAAAFIWVHAQSEKDGDFHLRAAERGAWVEFDGIRDTTLDRHLSLVEAMAKRKLLSRVLVSQDSGWYRVGEPGGGNFRTYDFILTTFVPRLRASFGKKAVRRLLVDNPRRALAGPA